MPLHGTGGRVGILKISEPGRVGAAVPYLVCSSDLSGFKFDPFNPNLLVTASDDTKIKGWILPEDGLDKENPVTKPDWTLGAPTMEKISLVLFHPRAKDVLLSASMDRDDPTIRLWDLKAQKEKLAIKGHKDTVCHVRSEDWTTPLEKYHFSNHFFFFVANRRFLAVLSITTAPRLYLFVKTKRFESGVQSRENFCKRGQTTIVSGHAECSGWESRMWLRVSALEGKKERSIFFGTRLL